MESLEGGTKDPSDSDDGQGPKIQIKRIPRFKKNQKTFSSGEVAYLIGVTTRTAGNMMSDSETVEDSVISGMMIPCFRLPKSKYRKVTRANLVAYLKRNGLIDSLREIGER